MTAFDTYGTSVHTARQLADLVTDRLGAAFVERDSDYLGVYLLATLSNATRIQIQPNAVPGDDGDLYDERHPDLPVLLLIAAPSPDPALHDRLAGIEGLARLTPTRS
ncbi:hypothetical protein SAMN05216532_7879 [Streptomyces sp. 2231.1]|uniref:hypothetical protein n=1 Tax=Streptomyces sp. 2231.1 TaxID=1855347 RepID=UPI00089C20AA|nr:hypothetical protein [Streptomyces sp. 2231.1]SEE35259.1 hypothetical protein SAMN05216532_7879 [Streptomyces sp. 2231.1]